MKLLLLLALLLPLTSFSDPTPSPTPPARPDIDELLTVSRVQKLSDQIMGQVKTMMERLENMAGLGANGSATAKAMNDKIMKLIQSEVSWEHMKPEYEKIYAEVYTPEEVKGIVTFYKSPAGQAFLNKQPLLMQKTMELSQRMMMDTMPKMQAALLNKTPGMASVAAGVATPASLDGKYVLVWRPRDTSAIDTIDFHPDGTCEFDVDNHTGVAGKYHFSGPDDPKLVVESGSADIRYSYTYTLTGRSLVLAPGSNEELTYAKVPKDRADVPFDQLVGIYFCRDPYGDCADQITVDHKFHLNCRSNDTQAHTCQDFTVDGTCTYADGIILYQVEKSTSPQPVQYLRDVVVKHDEKGLWVVNPYEGTIVPENPLKTTDLPPPPAGYTEAH